MKDAIKKAILKLNDAKTMDRERGHEIADDILCELLTELGLEEVVKEYDKIKKWYA